MLIHKTITMNKIIMKKTYIKILYKKFMRTKMKIDIEKWIIWFRYNNYVSNNDLNYNQYDEIIEYIKTLI